jgi:hypothetical protein
VAHLVRSFQSIPVLKSHLAALFLLRQLNLLRNVIDAACAMLTRKRAVGFPTDRIISCVTLIY